jgi:DNA-binding CsgD family transcriptional regulator
MNELSPREKQVLALTEEGYTSAEIAAKLGLEGRRSDPIARL